MASRVGFVVLFVGMIIFVLRLLLCEEAELQRDQGESYRRYGEAVPRLLPSITPRVLATGHAPNWSRAFRVGMMYWLEAVAVGAFAVTLKIVVFWVIFAAAMSSVFLLKGPERGSHPRRAEQLRKCFPLFSRDLVFYKWYGTTTNTCLAGLK